MMVVDGTPIKEQVGTFKANCREKNKTWTNWGVVPTMLFRVAEPDRFKYLVQSNHIASAKIIGIEFDTTLMWQPQMEALRRGVNPDLLVRR